MPPHIDVTWINGYHAQIDRETTNPSVNAHYRLPVTGNVPDGSVAILFDDNLGEYSVIAEIYEEWNGNFNLSHAPCYPPLEEATYSYEIMCWEPGENDVCFYRDHVTVTITGPGASYVVAETCFELVADDYTYTAVPDDGYTLVGEPSGEFTIVPCNGPGPCIATYSIETSCWYKDEINSSFFVDNVTLTLDGPDGPDAEIYVMTSNTQLELVPGDYFFRAVPDPGCSPDRVEEGEFIIEPCEEGGKRRGAPPPIYEISGLGYGGSKSIIGALVVTLLATLLALAFKMRYRLFDLFSRLK